MVNIVVAGIILVILGLAIYKIVKEKRKGAKCVGCPCANQGEGSCSCNIR